MLCMFFCIGGGNVALAEQTSNLTFTAACKGSGTADDKVEWEITSDAAESNFDSTRGIHYGTGSAAVSYLTLTTSGITGSITKIVVNASGASKTSAKLDVTVGGTKFGNQASLTSTATEYTFEGNATGEIVVKLSQTSATKALYVKSITVTYTKSTSPTLNSTESSLSFGNVETGSDKDLTFKLTGSNLTADATKLSITGEHAAMFSVTPSIVSPIDGTISETPITVKYKPTSTGDHTATLNIKSGEEASATVALSGTGIAPLAHYKVSWTVNGADYNEGTPSTDVIDGSKVTSLPTAPSAIYGKVFVGWTDTEISTSQDKAPSVLFNTASSAPAVTAKTTYYAVFASQSEGAHDETLSQTLEYDTWTYSGSTTDRSTYRLFRTDSYIESAEFDLSTLSKVVVYGGTFGGDSYNKLNIGDGTNTWKDVTVSGSSQTGVNTYTDGNALSGIGKLRVTSKSGTASNTGVRISKVDIYTRSYTYSDYVTTVTPTSPTTNTLTITPGTSTFAKATDITMSATIDGTKIYYTTDGTEPSQESILYEGAFKVTKTGTTVKAVAIADGYDNVTAEATYTIEPDQPVFSDESKIFKDAFDVTLSLPETTDATSKIHYAIGSTATAESEVYSSPINISSDTDDEKIILHAVVVDEYGNVGTEKYCTYTKTTAAIFDFTQRPNVWNIEPTSNNSSDAESNVVGKELAVDGIVMTSTSGGSNITCIYASSTNEPNLRVYAGGTITFTAPEGYNISEIKFTGSTLTKFISNSQTYTNPTWTGEAHSVTFTASGSVQVKTASIKIVPASSEVPTDVTLHVGDALYSTLYYSDRALVVPENTEAYTYTVTNGQLKESCRYDENETIPAGVGVVVFASEAGEYTFAVSSQAGDVDENNMLKGSDEDALTVGGDVYYKLSLNEDNEAGTIGFYWGAEDGAAFTNKAHKAYLALTKEAAGAAKSFLLDGTTNGIGNISVQKTMNAPLYNISGQRVGKSYKGMVISNGKKYIQK